MLWGVSKPGWFEPFDPVPWTALSGGQRWCGSCRRLLRPLRPLLVPVDRCPRCHDTTMSGIPW